MGSSNHFPWFSTLFFCAIQINSLYFGVTRQPYQTGRNRRAFKSNLHHPTKKNPVSPGFSVFMYPRDYKWLRHHMVILSSTHTRLMNFKSQLQIDESEISFGYVLISLPKRKIPSPLTRILGYYVPTPSKMHGSSGVRNGN